MKRVFKLILILLVVAIFFASCNLKKEAHKIEIVDGIKVVENCQPEWGDEPKIELEFVRKIGGLETKDENYIFHRPFDLVSSLTVDGRRIP